MTHRDFAAELPPAPIHQRLGITISHASIERVVGSMPVSGNEQPFGALHGGASVVLAESLGSIGTAIHAGAGARVSGIEVNATHHRPATRGSVTGTASPLHLGRTIATWNVTIKDSEDRLTCTARITCAIRPAADG